MMSKETPAFEVRNIETGKTYKIWADGRIEGFEDASVVLNRIPQLIYEALNDLLNPPSKRDNERG